MALQAGKKSFPRRDLYTLEGLAAQLHVKLVYACRCSPKGVVCELASHQQVQISASLVASTAKFRIVLYRPEGDPQGQHLIEINNYSMLIKAEQDLS